MVINYAGKPEPTRLCNTVHAVIVCCTAIVAVLASPEAQVRSSQTQHAPEEASLLTDQPGALSTRRPGLGQSKDTRPPVLRPASVKDAGRGNRQAFPVSLGEFSTDV